MIRRDILLTDAIRAKLIDNWNASRAAILKDGDCPDHKPVVKLFNPTGAATWLLTELDPTGDEAFGLCDLGFGTPELGYVSLSELGQIRGRLGLGIERDICFKATQGISEFARQARIAGHISA